ncbi:MAG: RNB domain-containing ribonuclease, partial [Lachnospiraceae bacterium]|nr:RNB domain-containing ribonuclease [Lachnospiraceae bacterium]
IGNLGYSLKGKHGEVHPKEMQKLLAKIEGEPEAGLIMRLSLRSMQQARYTAENLGHYGLAAKYYCHFTSPIRRYPDLQIHRIIKENLHGKLNEKRIAHYREMLDEVGSHCSSRERRADEVERETIKLKKIEYMQDHFNEVFTGVISGVTDYGIYVELPNTVEGMVRMVDIPGDYYEYIEEEYAVVGKDTGKTYKLGMEVKVMLKDIDRLSRTLDFVFEEEPS